MNIACAVNRHELAAEARESHQELATGGVDLDDETAEVRGIAARDRSYSGRRAGAEDKCISRGIDRDTGARPADVGRVFHRSRRIDLDDE